MLIITKCKCSDNVTIGRNKISAYIVTMDSNIREITNFILKLRSREELMAFLKEMLSESEIATLSKRWRILSMLAEGRTQRDIVKELNVSLCKVTRGSKILKDKIRLLQSILWRILKMETQTITNTNILPNEEGFFGNYGGQFLPEGLKAEFQKITECFEKLKNDVLFNKELNDLLNYYVGRPSPVYFAKNLSEKYGAEIYLKREDLNHTGARKINHCLGEALLAKKMGKKRIIAETGAGQHGVATATAAALLELECDIYMGEVDIQKARPNVERMKILGANVVSVKSGTMTLKEAFYELSRLEGIIPALESSQAVAYAIKLAQANPNEKILVNLSGRGDKDIAFVLEKYPLK